jgi:hypothetical protein
VHKLFLCPHLADTISFFLHPQFACSWLAQDPVDICRPAMHARLTPPPFPCRLNLNRSCPESGARFRAALIRGISQRLPYTVAKNGIGGHWTPSRNSKPCRSA